MSDLITFLLGPEEGLKKEFLDAEKKKLFASYPDMEIHNYYPADSDEDDLIRVLYDSSLFSTHRMIVIRHYEDVAKESKVNSDLVEFLKDPTEDVTIFVLSTQPSTYGISQKVLALIDSKKDVKIFYELFDNQKRDWIVKYFRENGLQITSDGVNELLDTVDNNTDEMRNSTENLTIFLKAKGYQRVTANEINAFLQHTKNEDANTLFEHIATRNLGSSLACLQAVLLQNKTASTQIVSTLLLRFRQLEAMKEATSRGASFDEALTDLVTMKLNDFSFPTLSRKRDKDTMRTAARNYKKEEAENAVRLLLKADNEIKSSQSDIEKEVLEYYVTLMLKNGGKEAVLTDGLLTKSAF
jgi:DNA polymerase III, delta subunit